MTKHSGFCVWMVEVCTKHGRKKLWFESLFLFVCYFIQGIRGLMSAQILRRISEKFPTFLDSIDMFAGTSTGSIISSLLAVQTPLDEVVNIYQTHAKEIFQNPSSVGQIFGGMSQYEKKKLQRSTSYSKLVIQYVKLAAFFSNSQSSKHTTKK